MGLGVLRGGEENGGFEIVLEVAEGGDDLGCA